MMAEFFSMGGYAGFVWPAFLISIIVLAGLVINTLGNYRKQQEILSAVENSRADDTES